MVIIKIVKRWVDKSENEYDDIFYEKGVFNKLSHLVPAFVISRLAPIPLHSYPGTLKIVITGTNLYVLVIVIMVIFAVINALHEIYNNTPIGQKRSIKGYVQVVKAILYFIGFLMIISIVFNKDLSSLFAGLTAFAAVLMFVFKDTILGLIAGIQISTYDLLRVGDYIEIPSKNIEGNIIDIKINIVKILNTNKTVSTLPIYYFVSETYHNWRGLEMSEGRRLKRYVNIDLKFIKFVDNNLISKLKNNLKTSDFINSIISEQNDINNFTNAKLFRLFIDKYLRETKYFNHNLTFVVRYLQPTENGLPLEIYGYTVEKDFIKYEQIQSEIFEYLIAIAIEFDIKIFQRYTN